LRELCTEFTIHLSWHKQGCGYQPDDYRNIARVGCQKPTAMCAGPQGKKTRFWCLDAPCGIVERIRLRLVCASEKCTLLRQFIEVQQ